MFKTIQAKKGGAAKRCQTEEGAKFKRKCMLHGANLQVSIFQEKTKMLVEK